MDKVALLTFLAKLARSQHGLVRLTQFEPCDRARVRRLGRDGHLEHMAVGVYRVNGAPNTWHQSAQVGVWALGSGALVSHRSAARLYRFDGFDGDHPIEFTVDRSRRGRSLPADLGAVVHTTTMSVTRAEQRHVDGFPVTAPTRTILDLCRASVAANQLEAAIDSAVRLRLTTIDRLMTALVQHRQHSTWGLAQLDALLMTSGGHTFLERRFLQIVQLAGLPIPKPQVVHRSDGRHLARVDFLFEEQGVVVEVSGGRGHSSAAERAKDARRRNGLQQQGLIVLEFTFEMLTGDVERVVATLRRSLQLSPK